MAGIRWRVAAFVLLAETFYVVLAVRFPLHRLYARVPPVDFAKLTGYSLWASVALLLAYAILFGLLAVLVGRAFGWMARGEPLQLSLRWAWAVAALFALPLFFLYPIFAIDMLMYGVRTRLWLFHHANPFLVPPAAFPSDPWVGLAGEWITATSGYSPLWEVVALVPALVAGPQRFLVHLWGLKVIALVAYLADVWILSLLVRDLYPGASAARLVYFAWNPLVLLELVGNGHNDGLMMTFVLLALWLVVRERDLAAHVAVAGGVLIKVTPLFLWPLLWLWGLARRRTWRGRARYTATVAVIVLLTLAVFAAFLWPDPTPWQALRESDSSGRTPQTLFILFAMAAGIPHAFTRVQMLFRGLFAIGYVAVLVWLWRSLHHREGPYTGYGVRRVYVLLHGWLAVLVLLIVIFASNWRPWYTTWLLALAVLSPAPAWTGGAFVLSLTAATGDVFWTNLRWQFRTYFPPLIAHLVGVPYVFGVPIAWAVKHITRKPAQRG